MIENRTVCSMRCNQRCLIRLKVAKIHRRFNSLLTMTISWSLSKNVYFLMPTGNSLFQQCDRRNRIQLKNFCRFSLGHTIICLFLFLITYMEFKKQVLNLLKCIPNFYVFWNLQRTNFFNDDSFNGSIWAFPKAFLGEITLSFASFIINVLR